MEDQHCKGEIGKVDEDCETEVECHHSGPDPRPRSPEKGQWGIGKFQGERRPRREPKNKVRPLEDKIADKCWAREGVVQHALQSAAVDPGWTDELRVATVAVADGHHEPSCGK